MFIYTSILLLWVLLHCLFYIADRLQCFAVNTNLYNVQSSMVVVKCQWQQQNHDNSCP